MTVEKNDITILRRLAKRYMDASGSQEKDKIKDLWRKLHDCKMERPMIYIWAIIFTEELEEVANLECEHPFMREMEKKLKIDLFHHSTGDDYILEPFLEFAATQVNMENGLWGVAPKIIESKGGAYKAYVDPPLKTFDDLSMVNPMGHTIDEEATAENLKILEDAVGDIIPVNVTRQPHYTGNFPSRLPDMRGMTQFMMDMADNPQGLHRLLEKLSKGAANAIDKADSLGNYSSADQFIQSCSYSNYTPDPFPIIPAKRKELWCYAQAQEFTLISPEMHKEFAIDYQKPIMEKFAASAYGCCEDLTNKIDILRKIKNLRQISVAPAANLEKCAEQIDSDYVISWRPNPTDQVCIDFDPDRIKRTISEGIEILKKYNCHFEINLKDIVSICHERERIQEWVEIVRSIIN